jgi:hypothetical protein
MDTSGHVFQGRFHSRLVEDDSHLLVASRYIEMNPVRAGICAHPLEWRWSSCRAATGLVTKPDFLDLWLAARPFRTRSRGGEAAILRVHRGGTPGNGVTVAVMSGV